MNTAEAVNPKCKLAKEKMYKLKRNAVPIFSEGIAKDNHEIGNR